MRKCVLTVTTLLLSPGFDVSASDDAAHEDHMKANEQGALVSLTIVMFAVTMQAWAQPYVDPDVNRAELFALMASYFVLLVGLGYRTQEAADGGLIGENYVKNTTQNTTNRYNIEVIETVLVPCNPDTEDKGGPFDAILGKDVAKPTCVNMLFHDGNFCPCSSAQWDQERGWQDECAPANQDTGPTMVLVWLLLACVGSLLTLPMIWQGYKLREKYMRHHTGGSDGDTDAGDDDYSTLDKALCRRTVPCRRDDHVEVKKVHVEGLALFLAIVIINGISVGIITQAGCPDPVDCHASIIIKLDSKKESHFYCRNHAQILDYMNFLVYVLVGAAVGYSLWVFVKKFGLLVDSWGGKKGTKLSNDTL